MVRSLLLKLIAVYRRTLSPDHGWFKSWFALRHPHGVCRYRPTCSEYATQAIERYGAVRGLARAVWRVVRCNPFSRGGWDPAVRS